MSAALPRAAAHPYPFAQSQLEAAIQQVAATRQIALDREQLEVLRATANPGELSRRIESLVRADEVSLEEAALEQVARRAPQASETKAAPAAVHDAHAVNAELEAGLRALKAGDYNAAALALHGARSKQLLRNEDHPGLLATIDYHLGVARSLQGQVDAEEFLQRSWKFFHGSLGESATQTAEAALEYGKVLNILGKFPLAVEPLQGAFRAFSRIYGKQHNSSYIAVAASELGHALIETEHYTEARAPLQKAIPVYQALWGDESSHTATSVHRLARTYLLDGEPNEAKRILQHYLLQIAAKVDDRHIIKVLTEGYIVQSDAMISESMTFVGRLRGRLHSLVGAFR